MRNSSINNFLFLAFILAMLIIEIKMEAPKGNVAKPGGAEPRGFLFLLDGQKTGANGIGKQNEQPKPPSKGMKVRGGRRKRDVLGKAGGNVGGWDHPIDSTYDYVDTMFKEANWLADVVQKNGWKLYGPPAGRR
ncbi:hypothetical protein GPALN_010432 [Globodera pallida]|nr:hypothetical protein GPALN_010432 [Globodera pallida]